MKLATLLLTRSSTMKLLRWVSPLSQTLTHTHALSKPHFPSLIHLPLVAAFPLLQLPLSTLPRLFSPAENFDLNKYLLVHGESVSPQWMTLSQFAVSPGRKGFCRSLSDFPSLPLCVRNSPSWQVHIKLTSRAFVLVFVERLLLWFKDCFASGSPFPFPSRYYAAVWLSRLYRRCVLGVRSQNFRLSVIL